MPWSATGDQKGCTVHDSDTVASLNQNCTVMATIVCNSFGPSLIHTPVKDRIWIRKTVDDAVTLNEWVCGKKLGAGSYAKVRMGRNIFDNREVTLRMVNRITLARALNNPQASETLLWNSARIMDKLSTGNRHIVQLYEVCYNPLPALFSLFHTYETFDNISDTLSALSNHESCSNASQQRSFPLSCTDLPQHIPWLDSGFGNKNPYALVVIKPVQHRSSQQRTPPSSLRCSNTDNTRSFAKTCHAEGATFARVLSTGTKNSSYAELGDITKVSVQSSIDHCSVKQMSDTPIRSNQSFLPTAYTDCFVFVLEYCDGGTLSKILNQPSLTLAEVRTILYQISDGLHFMHHNNIVHQDIKADNILLTSSLEKAGGDNNTAYSSADMRTETCTNLFDLLYTDEFHAPPVAPINAFNARISDFDTSILLEEGAHNLRTASDVLNGIDDIVSSFMKKRSISKKEVESFIRSKKLTVQSSSQAYLGRNLAEDTSMAVSRQSTHTSSPAQLLRKTISSSYIPKDSVSDDSLTDSATEDSEESDSFIFTTDITSHEKPSQLFDDRTHSPQMGPPRLEDVSASQGISCFSAQSHDMGQGSVISGSISQCRTTSLSPYRLTGSQQDNDLLSGGRLSSELLGPLKTPSSALISKACAAGSPELSRTTACLSGSQTAGHPASQLDQEVFTSLHTPTNSASVNTRQAGLNMLTISSSYRGVHAVSNSADSLLDFGFYFHVHSSLSGHNFFSVHSFRPGLRLFKSLNSLVNYTAILRSTSTAQSSNSRTLHNPSISELANNLPSGLSPTTYISASDHSITNQQEIPFVDTDFQNRKSGDAKRKGFSMALQQPSDCVSMLSPNTEEKCRGAAMLPDTICCTNGQLNSHAAPLEPSTNHRCRSLHRSTDCPLTEDDVSTIAGIPALHSTIRAYIQGLDKIAVNPLVSSTDYFLSETQGTVQILAPEARQLIGGRCDLFQNNELLQNIGSQFRTNSFLAKNSDMWQLGVLIFYAMTNTIRYEPLFRSSKEVFALIEKYGLLFTDLVCGLLCFNATERYTAFEVLKHPFFEIVHCTRNSSEATQRCFRNDFANLRRYSLWISARRRLAIMSNNRDLFRRASISDTSFRSRRRTGGTTPRAQNHLRSDAPSFQMRTRRSYNTNNPSTLMIPWLLPPTTVLGRTSLDNNIFRQTTPVSETYALHKESHITPYRRRSYTYFKHRRGSRASPTPQGFPSHSDRKLKAHPNSLPIKPRSILANNSPFSLANPPLVRDQSSPSLHGKNHRHHDHPKERPSCSESSMHYAHSGFCKRSRSCIELSRNLLVCAATAPLHKSLFMQGGAFHSPHCDLLKISHERTPLIPCANHTTNSFVNTAPTKACCYSSQNYSHLCAFDSDTEKSDTCVPVVVRRHKARNTLSKSSLFDDYTPIASYCSLHGYSNFSKYRLPIKMPSAFLSRRSPHSHSFTQYTPLVTPNVRGCDRLPCTASTTYMDKYTAGYLCRSVSPITKSRNCPALSRTQCNSYELASASVKKAQRPLRSSSPFSHSQNHRKSSGFRDLSTCPWNRRNTFEPRSAFMGQSFPDRVLATHSPCTLRQNHSLVDLPTVGHSVPGARSSSLHPKPRSHLLNSPRRENPFLFAASSNFMTTFLAEISKGSRELSSNTASRSGAALSRITSAPDLLMSSMHKSRMQGQIFIPSIDVDNPYLGYHSHTHSETAYVPLPGYIPSASINSCNERLLRGFRCSAFRRSTSLGHRHLSLRVRPSASPRKSGSISYPNAIQRDSSIKTEESACSNIEQVPIPEDVDSQDSRGSYCLSGPDKTPYSVEVPLQSTLDHCNSDLSNNTLYSLHQERSIFTEQSHPSEYFNSHMAPGFGLFGHVSTVTPMHTNPTHHTPTGCLLLSNRRANTCSSDPVHLELPKNSKDWVQADSSAPFYHGHDCSYHSADSFDSDDESSYCCCSDDAGSESLDTAPLDVASDSMEYPLLHPPKCASTLDLFSKQNGEMRSFSIEIMSSSVICSEENSLGLPTAHLSPQNITPMLSQSPECSALLLNSTTDTRTVPSFVERSRPEAKSDAHMLPESTIVPAGPHILTAELSPLNRECPPLCAGITQSNPPSSQHYQASSSATKHTSTSNSDYRSAWCGSSRVNVHVPCSKTATPIDLLEFTAICQRGFHSLVVPLIEAPVAQLEPSDSTSVLTPSTNCLTTPTANDKFNVPTFVFAEDVWKEGGQSISGFLRVLKYLRLSYVYSKLLLFGFGVSIFDAALELWRDVCMHTCTNNSTAYYASDASPLNGCPSPDYSTSSPFHYTGSDAFEVSTQNTGDMFLPISKVFGVSAGNTTASSLDDNAHHRIHPVRSMATQALPLPPYAHSSVTLLPGFTLEAGLMKRTSPTTVRTSMHARAITDRGLRACGHNVLSAALDDVIAGSSLDLDNPSPVSSLVSKPPNTESPITHATSSESCFLDDVRCELCDTTQPQGAMATGASPAQPSEETDLFAEREGVFASFTNTQKLSLTSSSASILIHSLDAVPSRFTLQRVNLFKDANPSVPTTRTHSCTNIPAENLPLSQLNGNQVFSGLRLSTDREGQVSSLFTPSLVDVTIFEDSFYSAPAPPQDLLMQRSNLSENKLITEIRKSFSRKQSKAAALHAALSQHDDTTRTLSRVESLDIVLPCFPEHARTCLLTPSERFVDDPLTGSSKHSSCDFSRSPQGIPMMLRSTPNTAVDTRRNYVSQNPSTSLCRSLSSSALLTNARCCQIPSSQSQPVLSARLTNYAPRHARSHLRCLYSDTCLHGSTTPLTGMLENMLAKQSADRCLGLQLDSCSNTDTFQGKSSIVTTDTKLSTTSVLSPTDSFLLPLEKLCPDTVTIKTQSARSQNKLILTPRDSSSCCSAKSYSVTCLNPLILKKEPAAAAMAAVPPLSAIRSPSYRAAKADTSYRSRDSPVTEQLQTYNLAHNTTSSSLSQRSRQISHQSEHINPARTELQHRLKNISSNSKTSLSSRLTPRYFLGAKKTSPFAPLPGAEVVRNSQNEIISTVVSSISSNQIRSRDTKTAYQRALRVGESLSRSRRSVFDSDHDSPRRANLSMTPRFRSGKILSQSTNNCFSLDTHTSPDDRTPSRKRCGTSRYSRHLLRYHSITSVDSHLPRFQSGVLSVQSSPKKSSHVLRPAAELAPLKEISSQDPLPLNLDGSSLLGQIGKDSVESPQRKSGHDEQAMVLSEQSSTFLLHKDITLDPLKDLSRDIKMSFSGSFTIGDVPYRESLNATNYHSMGKSFDINKVTMDSNLAEDPDSDSAWMTPAESRKPSYDIVPGRATSLLTRVSLAVKSTNMLPRLTTYPLCSDGHLTSSGCSLYPDARWHVSGSFASIETFIFQRRYSSFEYITTTASCAEKGVMDTPSNSATRIQTSSSVSSSKASMTLQYYRGSSSDCAPSAKPGLFATAVPNILDQSSRGSSTKSDDAKAFTTIVHPHNKPSGMSSWLHCPAIPAPQFRPHGIAVNEHRSIRNLPVIETDSQCLTGYCHSAPLSCSSTNISADSNPCPESSGWPESIPLFSLAINGHSSSSVNPHRPLLHGTSSRLSFISTQKTSTFPKACDNCSGSYFSPLRQQHREMSLHDKQLEGLSYEGKDALAEPLLRVSGNLPLRQPKPDTSNALDSLFTVHKENVRREMADVDDAYIDTDFLGSWSSSTFSVDS